MAPSKVIKTTDEELEAIRKTIRRLEGEVAQLETEDINMLTVKKKLSTARGAITRNQNKAEKLEKQKKIAVANAALAQESSEALKKRGLEPDAGAEAEQRQPKRKVRYSDLDRSSSLSPVPDDLISNSNDVTDQNTNVIGNNEGDEDSSKGPNDANNVAEQGTNVIGDKEGDKDSSQGPNDDNNDSKEDNNKDTNVNANHGNNSAGVEGDVDADVDVKGPKDAKPVRGTDGGGMTIPLSAKLVVPPVKGKARKGSRFDTSILSRAYAQLDEDEQLEFQRAGRVVFRQFCNASLEEQKVFEFPASLGATVRSYAEVLPESASISRELAIAMLTSTSKNRQCIHHMMSRKQSKEAEAFRISGVEAKRMMGGKGDRRQGGQTIFSCGCTEEKALWDFLIWKEFNVSRVKMQGGKLTMVMEAFGPMTIDPRRRSLVVDALKHWSGLMIDDMYTGTGDKNCAIDAKFPGFWGHTHQHKLASHTYKRMEWKIGHLQGLIDEEKERDEQDDLIWDWEEALRNSGLLEKENMKNGEASGSNKVTDSQ